MGLAVRAPVDAGPIEIATVAHAHVVRCWMRAGYGGREGTRARGTEALALGRGFICAQRVKR